MVTKLLLGCPNESQAIHRRQSKGRPRPVKEMSIKAPSMSIKKTVNTADPQLKRPVRRPESTEGMVRERQASSFETVYEPVKSAHPRKDFFAAGLEGKARCSHLVLLFRDALFQVHQFDLKRTKPFLPIPPFGLSGGL
jgi:hypothetical protein